MVGERLACVTGGIVVVRAQVDLRAFNHEDEALGVLLRGAEEIDGFLA